jgi:Ran GTPase-activating protein (RanGAP) involved in mRNA processing and transport
MIPLGEMLESDRCAFKTLNLANNGTVDEGARYIIKGLKGNASVTDLDLSENGITESSAERLADVARGLWRDGHKINDCLIKKIILSDNNFGAAGCRLLVRAFTAENFQHLEMANCGAGFSSAKIVAENVREVATRWRVLDLRGNNLGRQGLNLIFWGLRQNRSLRVLLLGDNRAGPMFGSDDDALLRHGVALQRALRANVVLRDLDLSYNGIDSQGGVNLFEALLENYTIRRVNLRGNVLDDDVQEALANLFRYNDVIEELDLGENKMGYQCCLSIAEGIECNRALKILRVDYNNLSSAGNMCLEAFVRCISMNTSLRVLIMDGNKLGSEWGVQLADALARNNTLVKVSLRDSRFDSRAGLMLLNAYVYNSLLMELALSADEVGEEVWLRFKQEFAKKRAYVDPASEVNNETSVEDFGAAFCLKYFGLD